jgi:hypothetical protein
MRPLFISKVLYWIAAIAVLAAAVASALGYVNPFLAVFCIAIYLLGAIFFGKIMPRL